MFKDDRMLSVLSGIVLMLAIGAGLLGVEDIFMATLEVPRPPRGLRISRTR